MGSLLESLVFQGHLAVRQKHLFVSECASQGICRGDGAAVRQSIFRHYWIVVMLRCSSIVIISIVVDRIEHLVLLVAKTVIISALKRSLWGWPIQKLLIMVESWWIYSGAPQHMLPIGTLQSEKSIVSSKFSRANLSKNITEVWSNGALTYLFACRYVLHFVQQDHVLILNHVLAL